MKTIDELKELIADAEGRVEIGAQYRHYKGGEYTVRDIAIQEATEEAVVIYESSDGALFTRPADEFIEEVADGQPRFRRM